MQVVKDAATLALLILLALSVRIDVDGAPLEIDLNPPADAAESQAEVERPEMELPAQPAAMPAPAARPVIEKKVERLLLLEANGQRFEVLLDGDEIVVPKRLPPAAAEPCRDLFATRYES
jgi:hypothetical protein